MTLALSSSTASNATPVMGASASPSRPDCGDDLVRARSFSDRARIDMDAIIHADRSDDRALGRDVTWLSERLCDIQRASKLSRARAVYRSAQTVLSLIQRASTHMPIDWARVDGRLMALNKLLAQYDQGLTEVEAELSVAELASAPVPATPPAPVSAPPANDIQTAYTTARQTLSELLPHASPAEQAALQNLIDAPYAQPAPEPVVPQARLEDAMPELIQSLLGEARNYGKMLSVSYALDNVCLAEDRLDSVIAELHAQLGMLIAASLPLNGVGHLDIVAGETGLDVSGSGFAPFVFALNTAELDTAERDRAESHAARPTPKPMITDETEADLRAQLAALLDPSL